MENNCTMVRNTEDEIELELGLSIGGNSIREAEKLKPIKKESFDTDLRDNRNHNHEKCFAFVDPLMKREIHALRRQEAKKKREEKQQKKRICRGNKNGENINAGFSVDSEERECKRNRREDIKNVNLNLSIEENMNQNVGPVHYPYPNPNPNPLVHCVNHGFAYPVAGRKTTSNGSPICSSSSVSDNRSSSHEGGSSSDTKSHSSHSLPEQHQLNGSHEHSSSSQQMEISHITDKTTNCVEMFPSDITQSSPTRAKEESVSDTQPVSTEKSVSNRSPSPLEETKVDMSKPPKPQTRNHNTPSLPHMPCVSTTGNGPNGKTINGFLYRYTKTEVNIICVCHGTSFSPAEFVQHAGGTAVTNPLRHITVIPSAF